MRCLTRKQKKQASLYIYAPAETLVSKFTMRTGLLIFELAGSFLTLDGQDARFSPSIDYQI